MFEKIFNEYTSDYDFSNSDIKLKYNHSYRVRNLALKYAKLLNFSNEDKRLAEFIGLYHDIGRFFQLNEYKTYDDNCSMDHALASSNILFKDKLIDKFSFTDEEKEIIKFAIENHNKYTISETSNKRALIHAKLIRDVDKLDIVYLYAYLDEIELVIADSYDNKLIDVFKAGIQLNFHNKEEFEVLKYFGFVFDLNYDEVIKEFMDNLKQFYKILEPTPFMSEIYKISISKLERRLNNDK